MNQLKDDIQNKAKRTLIYQFGLGVIESEHLAKFSTTKMTEETYIDCLRDDF